MASQAMSRPIQRLMSATEHSQDRRKKLFLAIGFAVRNRSRRRLMRRRRRAVETAESYLANLKQQLIRTKNFVIADVAELKTVVKFKADNRWNGTVSAVPGLSTDAKEKIRTDATVPRIRFITD